LPRISIEGPTAPEDHGQQVHPFEWRRRGQQGVKVQQRVEDEVVEKPALFEGRKNGGPVAEKIDVVVVVVGDGDGRRRREQQQRFFLLTSPHLQQFFHHQTGLKAAQYQQLKRGVKDGITI
jgi:hypothetical protein